MASYRPVTAALRVLDVLASVSQTTEGATVGDIHRKTKLDKATIVRMLTTLAHAGYVVRDYIVREDERIAYRATGKTLQLSAGYDRHTAISAIVSQDLQEFRQQIAWPSDVAIFDRDAMIVVDTSRQAEPMQFRRVPGFRAAVLVTSLGLAYLAHCPETERAEYIALAAQDPNAVNDLARQPDALHRKLEQVRRQGYATMDEMYSRENYHSQFFSIGVPIMTETRIFGSLNIIYLRSALSPDEARDSLLKPLQTVARKMATRLAEHSHNK